MAGAWLDAADTIVTALTTTALAAASPPPPSPPPTARAAPHRPPPPSPPPTWQVAYDLDASGISLAEFDVGKGAASPPRRHYEAWLDYAYYTANSLRLAGYQESLSEEQARRIYKDGDALPNAWHPSDHIPVGCVFEWG